ELESGVFINQFLGKEQFCYIFSDHVLPASDLKPVILARIQKGNLIKLTNDSRRQLIKKIKFD
ncbi:MAG: hypothetical protein WD512_07435, partial [Candidatus Paceibacterota bacterium]